MNTTIKTAWQTITDALTQLPDSEREVELRVLKGEWMPPKDGRGGYWTNDYWTVAHKTEEIKHGYTNAHCSFAPNEALAKELSKVIQGKWLPKKGDDVFACSRDNLQTFYKNGKYSETYRFTADKDFEGNADHYDRIFFPSEPQRANYIASLQVKGAKKENPFLVRGVFGGEVTLKIEHPAFEGITCIIDGNGFLKIKG